MNLKEAYSILEIPQTSTPEEAKKRYRKLTKKFHPDVSKEPDADAKFKKINEAYQVITSGKSTTREVHTSSRQTFVTIEHIQLQTIISFAESVLGCTREIKIARKVKCQDCKGQGEVPLNNGCTKCGGRGHIVMQQGAMNIVQTCDKCYGRMRSAPCTACQGNGSLDAESSVHVAIPGGISNGNTLRLAGKGNYAGSFIMMDTYSDAHLHIIVTPEPGLILEGKDVVCTVSISLLDAMTGCHRSVKTIKGQRDIVVPPLSRNKDEISLAGLGVNGVGKQRVILDVTYPDDPGKLIDVLQEN